MGAEAKRYLQDHSIPQLFEGLMTGLIYNKPEDPIGFLQSSINRLRENPDLALKWDSFVEFCPEPNAYAANASNAATGNFTKGSHGTKNDKTSIKKMSKPRVGGSVATSTSPRTSRPTDSKNLSRKRQSPSPITRRTHQGNGTASQSRSTSLSRTADNAQINENAPIILFIGGPGGGKTRYATRLCEEMASTGLVHICMPDLVRQAVSKYKDTNAEWKLAAERYNRGELIPSNLAQDLVKAEMGRHPKASAYLLEGFPREARQVEDFEKNIGQINMAMILDYDEDSLRRHMEARGLTRDVIDRRIHEFTNKTLNSARYFDDQRILHLIPGEKSSKVIFERMRKLVTRTMEAGVNIQMTRSSMSDFPQTPDTITSQNSQPDASSQKINVCKPSSRSSSPIITSPEPVEINQTAQEQTGNIPMNITTASDIPNIQNNLEKDDVKSDSSTSVQSSIIRNLQKELANLNSVSSTKSDKTGQIKKHPKRQASRESLRSSSSISITSLIPEKAAVDAETNGTAHTTAAAILESEQHVQSDALSPPLVEPNAEIETGKKEEEKTDKENAEETDAKKTENIDVINSTNNNINDVSATIENDNSLVDNIAKATNEESESENLFFKALPSNTSVILIIGAPGSNKSEFAERVARKYENFIHISMGALFRQKVLENPEDELWIRIGRKMDAGEIIPMKICRELLYNTIQDLVDTYRGFVIEGYPRTLPQVEDFEAQLKKLDVAILIDCTEQYCKETLKNRLQKSANDGAPQRGDDEESTVQQRLSFFKQNTLPMLKYLDDKGKLRVVREDREHSPHNSRVGECGEVNLKSDAAWHDFQDTEKIEGDTNLEIVFQDMIDAINSALAADVTIAHCEESLKSTISSRISSNDETTI